MIEPSPPAPVRRRHARRRAGGRLHAAVLAVVALAALGVPSSPAPARATGADALAGTWSWPLSPRPQVTRPYELEHPYAAGHRGIDLAAEPGSTVLAPAPGTVRFAGVVVDRPVLSIDHGGGVLSSFEPVDAEVAEGDAVVAGQRLGTVAAAVVHAPGGGLHLGARLEGGYVDPRGLLGQIPRAVLLPAE